jgi:hypothetical protein
MVHGMTTPATSIAVPTESDWIVSIRLREGRTVKFRVSPGTVSEELAAARALKAGRVPMDAVAHIDVVRAADHCKVSAEDYETQLRALMRGRDK